MSWKHSIIWGELLPQKIKLLKPAYCRKRHLTTSNLDDEKMWCLGNSPTYDSQLIDNEHVSKCLNDTVVLFTCACSMPHSTQEAHVASFASVLVAQICLLEAFIIKSYTKHLCILGKWESFKGLTYGSIFPQQWLVQWHGFHLCTLTIAEQLADTMKLRIVWGFNVAILSQIAKSPNKYTHQNLSLYRK